MCFIVLRSRLNKEVNHFCSSSQAAPGDRKLVAVQQDLYSAVSSASSWLDSAENHLLTGPVLLPEDTETQLTNLEVWKMQ